MHTNEIHSRSISADALLSLAAVATRTSMSVAFFRKAIVRRELGVVRVGRAVRVRESELARFLNERTRPAREGARR